MEPNPNPMITRTFIVLSSLQLLSIIKKNPLSLDKLSYSIIAR